MPLLLVILVVPFILFLGGAYILHYPVTLAVLYGLNFGLMYLVLWAIANQILKIQTQRMTISEGNLLLSRKQMYMSFPIINKLELEVPLDSIRDISLATTRVGYLLTLRFDQEGKTMGVDLDINPLSCENGEVLQEVLTRMPDITADEGTRKTLCDYTKEILLWKGNYMLSFFVLSLALVIFLAVSIYLGTKLH